VPVRASGIRSLYPVARESQKFPPKNSPVPGCIAVPERMGNTGVVALSACRPKVNRPRKRDHCEVDRRYRSAEAGVWHVQDAHASFLPGDMFLSKSMSSPSVSTASVPTSESTGADLSQAGAVTYASVQALAFDQIHLS